MSELITAVAVWIAVLFLPVSILAIAILKWTEPKNLGPRPVHQRRPTIESTYQPDDDKE